MHCISDRHTHLAGDTCVTFAIVMFGGCEITGFSVSATSTTNDPVVVLPPASVAVQLTAGAPIGKNESDAGVHTSVGAAASVNRSIAGDEP